MSEKKTKVIKNQVKKQLKINLKEVAVSFQNLILKFTLKKRLKIAWAIVQGKPFLEGLDIPEEKQTLNNKSS